jgi:formiminotetrahydrofolate cyclodeaminase
MGDATRLSDLTLHDLAERLASRDPVPGGGSAAALAGALGAALVSMVVELTAGRPEAAGLEEELREIAAAAGERRQQMLDLADEDATAYQAVVAARRLPRQTEAEQQTRAAAVHAATLEAARVPLRTAGVAGEVLELAARVAPIGNRNAVSDAGVAAQLSAAALRGALLNVRINLPYLPADEPLRASAAGEADRLEAMAAERERSALTVVGQRMQPA